MVEGNSTLLSFGFLLMMTLLKKKKGGCGGGVCDGDRGSGYGTEDV